jgi:tetratricopeptide (TPR) repeat protein
MFLPSAWALFLRREFRLFPVHFAGFLLLFGCIVPVLAQGGGGIDFSGTGGNNTINGRIYFPSGRRSDSGLKVRLESTNSGGLMVFSDSNGSFSFRSLEPGSYTLTIDGGIDYENVRETVQIDDTRSRTLGITTNVPRVFTIPIYLQPKRTVKSSNKPGVLDAALANVPEQARGLYNDAQESERAGDTKKAIEQLKSAISLYPEFGLALNELGVLYLKLGQPDKAIDPLKTAVSLTPDSFNPRLNHGIALWGAKRLRDAEAELRQALKRNDSSAIAHMYLGMCLIGHRGVNDVEQANFYEEAEKEFVRAVELSSDQVARAHYYLGGIFWRKQNFKKAADELEIYLKLSPNAPKVERERTLSTIKELRSKT